MSRKQVEDDEMIVEDDDQSSNHDVENTADDNHDHDDDDEDDEMEELFYDENDQEEGDDEDEMPLSIHLRLAIEHGDLARVRSLVETEQVNIHECDLPLWSMLLSAAYCGHLSVVKYLVERGADVQYRSEVSCLVYHIF